MTDLFAAAAEIRRAERAPLADRLRPLRLDDIVGQDQLLGTGRPLRSLIEADTLGSIILWGPPGTGKTTLARVTAEYANADFIALSAVLGGVADVRKAVAAAAQAVADQVK